MRQDGKTKSQGSAQIQTEIEFSERRATELKENLGPNTLEKQLDLLRLLCKIKKFV